MKKRVVIGEFNYRPRRYSQDMGVEGLTRLHESKRFRKPKTAYLVSVGDGLGFWRQPQHHSRAVSFFIFPGVVNEQYLASNRGLSPPQRGQSQHQHAQAAAHNRP